MATAQNFFNATPAPDPQLNPLMAALAGGLQGASNQGDYQKQLQMMMYQNQQKQLTDAMNAGIQNHQAGFGQGPAGSTPMQFAGQQGYWDPNGMGPSGQMDMAKAQLYQTMNDQKAQSGTNLEAHTMATTLLKGIADKYSNDTSGAYGLDKFQGDTAAAMDFVKKKYGLDKPQEDQGDDSAPQPWQPGQPKSEGQPVAGGPTVAQQMFSKATGSQNSLTPRAQRNSSKADPAIQAKIDAFKKQGHSADRIKTDMRQKGYNPDDYNI